MAKRINILSSDVYNRISAGEVVENPASVVKELVENALDAGGKNITIEIADGGTKLIKVVDDGGGINFEDLDKVFLPHATSKIAKASDLESILTLGFRGEALASIASVSQVEILSKTMESEVGGKITIQGGQNQEITECPFNNGTSVSVKNLFFNTPARLKFLKSLKQEENLVTNIVNRLMLANPEISFKYIVNGKIVYNSVINGLIEKIFMIYGKETVQNLIPINTSNGDFALHGFISKPSFCKANKTYQTLIVNNRYISNTLVAVAVSNAYENFLMKGKFPLFVLNLSVDNSDIDVNVHPSKMEVKFREPRKIYEFFYSSILSVLNESNSALSFVGESELSLFERPSANTSQSSSMKEVSGGFSFGDMQSLKQELENLNVSAPTYNENELTNFYSNSYHTYIEATTEDKNLETDSSSTSFDNTMKERLEFDFFSKENINFDPFNDDFKPKTKSYVEQQEIKDNLFYKIVGTLFSTYIIVEMGETCYLIDEHAGHERVLYDKLLKDYEKKKIVKQDLLMPYIFEVNPVEKNLIEENLDVFSDLGFEIDSFGTNSYKINSIPHILSGIKLNEFIKECLKDPNKISKNNEEIKNKFARSACRSAVKSGDELSSNEIEILLKQIMKNDRILLCPHGRPICVKLTKYDLEKMFKRVV